MSLLAPPFVTLTPFAKLSFYLTGTLTLATIYADADLATPLPNPLVADVTGRFDPVFLSDDTAYRVIARNALGVVIADVDPVTPRDNLAAMLATGTGATLVGFKAAGSGTVTRTVAAKLGDVVSVKDYGATGDGVTDDTVALGAMVAAVNATFTLGGPPVSIVFPGGIYKFSATLGFDRPVSLIGENDATLNYTGTDYAVRLGPTNLLNSPNAFSYQEMTVDGLRFTGGTAAAGGIYISDSILEPRLRNLTFMDFGVAGSWCIFGQANNWNTLIENCRVFSLNRLNAAPSFININGVSVDSTPDGGNSRVTVRDCWMTSYNATPMGVFARLNAVASRVVGGGCQWASVGVSLAPAASDVTIDALYCEVYTTGGAMVGVASSGSGANYLAAQGVKLLNSYCNLHQSSGSSVGARVVKMLDVSARLTGWEIENLTYADTPADYTIIEQNNVVGQTGNRFSNVRPLFVPGASDVGARANFPLIQSNVANWASSDGVVEITAISGNYTLRFEDIGALLALADSAAVLTVPPSGAMPNLPVGTRLEARNASGGTQTVVAGAGVTLVLSSTGGTGTRTLASGALARLTCLGSNLWAVDGPGVT